MPLTVALSAFIAWSREKPMETMVATLSSEGGSGQAIVDPGPLDPGRTNGLAKSAAESGTQVRAFRSLQKGYSLRSQLLQFSAVVVGREVQWPRCNKLHDGHVVLYLDHPCVT